LDYIVLRWRRKWLDTNFYVVFSQSCYESSLPKDRI